MGWIRRWGTPGRPESEVWESDSRTDRTDGTGRESGVDEVDWVDGKRLR